MRNIGIAVLLVAATGFAQSPTAIRPEQLTPNTSVPFLVRVDWQRHSIYGMHYERTCAVIYPDGRYHVERGDVRSKRKDDKVYEGSLSAEQRNELEAMIGDPQLLTTPTNIQFGRPTRDSEIIVTAVSRPDGLHSFGFMSNEGSPSVSSVLRALTSWTDKLGRETKPVKGAIPDYCRPH